MDGQNINLDMPHLQHDLVVCLVRRRGADRMDPKRPEALELVAGWPDPREGKDKQPRMVSVLMNDTRQLESALHKLADLWGAMYRRDHEANQRILMAVQ